MIECFLWMYYIFSACCHGRGVINWMCTRNVREMMDENKSKTLFLIGFSFDYLFSLFLALWHPFWSDFYAKNSNKYGTLSLYLSPRWIMIPREQKPNKNTHYVRLHAQCQIIRKYWTEAFLKTFSLSSSSSSFYLYIFIIRILFSLSFTFFLWMNSYILYT